MIKSYLYLCASILALSGVAHAGETETFTYDVHGRLVKVEIEKTGSAPTPNDGAVIDYTFDDVHNRTETEIQNVPPPPP
ncbi:MAG: hypothetical protein AAGC95_16280 [Pseudomonadota bacterium]